MRRFLTVSGLLLATAYLSGQETPAFETASIKPSQLRNGQASLAGGRLVMPYATLRELVTFAYPRQDGRVRSESEIVGGPTWMNADHFELVAKAEGPGLGIDAGNTSAAAATSAELQGINRVRLMLRSLLADRFKLTAHNELREAAVYTLLMDRNDRKPGPQLKAIQIDCVALRAAGNAGICGGFRMASPGHLTGHAATIPLLAAFLEVPVSRIVIDRTGLQGTFDLELQWTPDQPQRPGVEAPAADPGGVSIYTAVREQLGLKLESTRAPVDVLVIDRADRPTPD